MKCVYLDVKTILSPFGDRIYKFSVKLSLIDKLKILFSKKYVWFEMSESDSSRFN